MGGGSLTVFGMVLSNGFTHLERLEGRVNNVIYCNIFGHGVLQFQENIYGKIIISFSRIMHRDVVRHRLRWQTIHKQEGFIDGHTRSLPINNEQ